MEDEADRCHSGKMNSFNKLTMQEPSKENGYFQDGPNEWGVIYKQITE